LTTTDGRLVRGERRRAQLISATLALIESNGVAAVSHRSVSRIAEVSPSAVLHHFQTLDDLLVAALVRANDESMAALALVRDVTGLAAYIISELTEHRARTVALYELYLLAARRPALRPEAGRWMDAVKTAALRLGADEPAATALVAVVDGLGLQALVREQVTRRTEILDALTRVLTA
jgi:DNA-binding transcriptional regulator YbjK